MGQNIPILTNNDEIELQLISGIYNNINSDNFSLFITTEYEKEYSKKFKSLDLKTLLIEYNKEKLNQNYSNDNSKFIDYNKKLEIIGGIIKIKYDYYKY
jgi:Na+/phosphate symporter